MFNSNKDIEEIVEDTHEDTLEDIEVAQEEDIRKGKLRVLKEKLKVAEKEKMTCLEDLQRMRADFLNSICRLTEQLAVDTERAKEDFIQHLLPLADSFDMAFAHTDTWEGSDAGWRKGVEAIHTQLQSIFKSYDVTTIDAVGDVFDPNTHEAVSTQVGGGGAASDTVVAVLQKGYRMNDRLIRPAKVIISA